MLSAEFHLGLMDSIVGSAERLCEDKIFCLGHRKKVSSALRLLKVDHPKNEYLNQFVADRNTRASAALGKLVLVIPGVEVINSIGRFCLLLVVWETCCRQACLVVTPSALLRVL